MRVQAGPDRGAAEGNLAEPLERPAHTSMTLPHLRRIAAELLAERDRNCIHQVRPPRLDDVVELDRFRLERFRQLLECRQEVAGDLVERREMYSGREDVVRRLTHVHVVVRVHVLAGKCGDYLVGVHVRGGSRAGLEDIDRKLVVQFADRNAIGSFGDSLGLLVVEQPELGIDARGRSLDSSQPAGNGRRNRFARDGKIANCLGRFGPPKLALRFRLGH